MALPRADLSALSPRGEDQDGPNEFHRFFRHALQATFLEQSGGSLLGVDKESERSPLEEDRLKRKKQAEESHERALVIW